METYQSGCQVSQRSCSIQPDRLSKEDNRDMITVLKSNICSLQTKHNFVAALAQSENADKLVLTTKSPTRNYSLSRTFLTTLQSNQPYREKQY
jgi:hypothetical protein